VDRITAQMMGEFAAENDLTALPEDKQFEHLTAFAMVRRHYSRSFVTADVVLGGGADTGIDAIAIIVNNNLVTDVDQVTELAEQNGYVDATFVFIQSERTAGFNASKIGNFAFGVTDFFQVHPKLPRSAEIEALAEITNAIFNFASIMRPPRAYLYYATTGLWNDDANLIARRDAAIADVKALSIFENPEMVCVGSSGLHEAYRRTRAPITRTFEFDRRVPLPPTDGVTSAAIGYVKFSQFKTLIADESGNEILTSIFEDNVRDWQSPNNVNSGMRDTLHSQDRSKFVLMNNGVTIITRNLAQVGERFTVSDYQVVNGCQTSNVLFENRDDIGDDVAVPLRLIHTSDERINELITKATNSQTDIKPEQFASRLEFARELEAFFATYPAEHRLYYERRDGQYDREAVPKVKIVDTATAIRSYASIFLEIPHAATKNYRSIRGMLGDELFVENHKYTAYYYASFAWDRLETFYRNKTIDSAYKSARFHILMTVNLLIDGSPRPFANSKEIERRAEKGLQVLWDPDKAEETFKKAVELIDEVTGGDLDRDHVRTEAITNALIAKLRPSGVSAVPNLN
jgi:hypothetical protein